MSELKCSEGFLLGFIHQTFSITVCLATVQLSELIEDIKMMLVFEIPMKTFQ